MNRIITLIVMAILVSGCQMTQVKIGTGPITLSPVVTKFYKEKYLKQAGPEVFVVSKDGRFANYIFCSDGPGACRSPIAAAKVSDRCKALAKAECYIFDEGGRVVWDGPVQYGSNSNSSNSFTKLSIADLCKISTSTASNNRIWDYTIPNTVNEAKRRGLTTEKCMEILDDNTAPAKSNIQPSPESSVEESLETIKRLLERGLITDEEAKQKRVDLLKKIN